MGKTGDLFMKIRDTKRTFHAKMGKIKDIRGMDLTEAEEIKKRWQEYTEEIYKKGLNDTDNHNGVITHLEPDILECKVKWALGSITTNKASGGDGIPVELFQILKDDAVKVLHSICQQIWKTQQWPQDWKRSVFILSQRKAMPKNAQTTSQLHSSHMLARRRQWQPPGNLLQYYCLENPIGRGAWWAAFHGVAKSQTQLSDFTFTFHFHTLEKEMAAHSSILARRIPGTAEPGGLPSIVSHRVGHD